MNLLEFARGPALDWSLTIFVLGVLWRLIGVFLMHAKGFLSEPRRSTGQSMAGGAKVIGSRSWPHPEFVSRTGYGEALGYAYHIGLILVVAFGAPHIQFIKGLFGVSWASLPSGIIGIIAVLTLALLIAVAIRRLTHPVLRRISGFDDYFSLFLVIGVMVTGLMATYHIGAPYPDLLAWHILSFCALLVWFPFGKLMHAFWIVPQRAISGYRLSRKGAST